MATVAKIYLRQDPQACHTALAYRWAGWTRMMRTRDGYRQLKTVFVFLTICVAMGANQFPLFAIGNMH